MIRKIIKINEEKCIGCGACAAACHEGAIEMINGIAKLTREDYCDGLGDCLPACPTDAISFEEAIAAPKEIYYPKKLARDTAAREDFQREKGRGSVLTETYILDIIRQGWKNDDERLQRVVLG